jgi:4-hydroxy-tetrahydrodipicolinate synthase
MIAIGAQGVISVTANVVPRLVHDMTQAALDGNFEKAKKIHYDLLDLSKCLFLETNPIPVKYALKQMGKISGELRLPLCEMSKPNADKLRDAMRQLKLVS